jgi:hypothetical protein
MTEELIKRQADYVAEYRRLLWCAKAADTIEAQAAEIKRLREALAHLANTINIVGSHYHRAQVAIDDLVLDVKKSARAALRETK